MKKLLFVGGDALFGQFATEVSHQLGIEAVFVSSRLEFEQYLRQQTPDFIIIDQDTTDDTATEYLPMIARLRAVPKVVVLSSAASIWPKLIEVWRDSGIPFIELLTKPVRLVDLRRVMTT